MPRDKDTAPPVIFVFPLPADAVPKLPQGLAAVLAYYHDRPLLFPVQQAFGAPPEFDDDTRSAVLDAIEAQIEALGLEERLYRNATSKNRCDIRGFVAGPTVADLRAICEREGWKLVLPLDEPEEPLPAPAPKPKARKPKAPTPPPEIPRPLATKIAKIEAIARKTGRTLPKGATFDAILALEKKIGVALPLEVRAFYLAHDGGGSEIESLIDGRHLLDLDGIGTYWEMCKDADEEELDEEVEAGKGIRAEWWNPGWIPVSHDLGGNHHMLDLAPAKGGKSGQIISYYHDDAGRSLSGADFLGWLERSLKSAAE